MSRKLDKIWYFKAAVSKKRVDWFWKFQISIFESKSAIFGSLYFSRIVIGNLVKCCTLIFYLLYLFLILLRIWDLRQIFYLIKQVFISKKLIQKKSKNFRASRKEFRSQFSQKRENFRDIRGVYSRECGMLKNIINYDQITTQHYACLPN